MNFISRHIISKGSKLRKALKQINNLPEEGILFITEENDKLIGSVTDGDIRRALLINNRVLESNVEEIMNKETKYVYQNLVDVKKIIQFREENYKIVPVLNQNNKIVDLVNFKHQKSLLPIDMVIMAGGKGKRLRPLTLNTPKPLLKLKGQTLIEYGLNHAILFGIENFWITIGYLGEQIEDYLNQIKKQRINFNFIKEEIPLGTIGSISKIKNFYHENILISNADLITDLDLEKFYLHHIKHNSDLTILVRNYDVKIPFGVIEYKGKNVKQINEKPTLRNIINGGIYLLKREYICYIPRNTFFNATDLIEKMISKGLRVRYYIHNGIWNDLGRLEDFKQSM